MKKFCHLCGSKYIEGKSQPWECANCGNKSYENSKPCAEGVIFNRSGHVLITKRAINPGKGKYDLPGGFVMLGETIEEALFRELHEELGLQARDFEKVEFCTSWAAEYVFSQEVLSTITIDFAMITKTNTFKAMDDAESADFYAIDAIDALSFSYPEYPSIIRKAYKQLFE